MFSVVCKITLGGQGCRRWAESQANHFHKKRFANAERFFVFVGGEKKGAHCKKDAPLEMLFGIDVLFFAVANFIEEVCHL